MIADVHYCKRELEVVKANKNKIKEPQIISLKYRNLFNFLLHLL